MNESEFDVLEYLRTYAEFINARRLTIKEMDLLTTYFRVPEEELGIELEDPVLESCFSCSEWLEKSNLVVVEMPFCKHRAHLECIGKQPKAYCTYCASGIRSSLLSYLRGRYLAKKAREAAEDMLDEHGIAKDPQSPLNI